MLHLLKAVYGKQGASRKGALILAFTTALCADQVVLKNGDRVTGSIVKKDAKEITIKTDKFGLVTTAWDEVASIIADKPLTVVLPDKTVSGTLREENGRVQIATGTGTVTVAPADITALRDADEQKAFQRLDHPGWLQLWAGTATIGFAGTAGNARTSTFTTAVTAARATRTDKTSIYFNTIRASAFVNGQNSDTAEAVRGGVGYSRNIRPRVFLNVFNDYEYDRFQNLDLRAVFGGGIGFHAIKTDRMMLDLLGGADYNYSKFSTFTRNNAELYWGDDFTYKLKGSTSIVQSYRMFNDLNSLGDYRVNFDIGMTTKIAKWLNWNVSFSDRYLTNPAPGRKTNDLLYTTGLGVNFAH
ncbi:DUF481 domain-containing protein [Bryobacter aggregatus]|uniref:DUF481 domain-containing protein n=1 Tax=Bryobacter aggregatus TaxID=360054 RepID=UPI0004E124F4|nr:DUF481 domain-containing protein [Bryobacter aggregatus]